MMQAMDKRIISMMICAMFLGGATLVNASEDYSQKNYLSTRPHGINSAMEYTTWHEHAYANQEKTIHSNLQAAFFYQHSQHSDDIGEYFGIGNGKNSFTIGKVNPEATTGNADIDSGLIIHNSESKPSQLKTVKLEPYQEAFGLRLDYFQDINHPFRNLFFKASAPIVYVSTDMEMKIIDDVPVDLGNNLKLSLKDFFAGDINVDDKANYPHDLQRPLTRAKIAGRRSTTGVADLDFGLGYKYLHDDKKHVYFSIDLTIPTGNRVRGEYLFEPIYGDGHHVGLGASLDTGFELWQEKGSDLRILWATRYKYLFEGTEDRTLSLKDLKLSHYYLAAKDQQHGLPVFPLANILTLPLTIKPGSLIDTMVDVAFHSSGFTIDLGYNLFWKDGETVHVKCFKDNKYGIVKPEFDTDTIFNDKDLNAGPDTEPYTGKLITSNDLDVDSVKTPALLTHKLFAGLGYTFTMYQKYLLSTGIGASYEFATSNADLENYAFWAKVNFSF